MKVPFHFTQLGRRRRRARRSGETPVESALRRSLASHAFETPDADDLTRRILASAAIPAGGDDYGPRLDEHSSGDRLRTWGLPLVAAACVAAVVGVGAVVTSLDHGNGHHHNDAASRGPTVAPTSPRASGTDTPRSASPSATYGVGTSGLKNVKIIDLTFFHLDSGVALASAHCITGPGRCTALLQTSDGTTWYPKGGVFGFDVKGIKAGCPASKCVDHIRFADDQDGYAYGPDAFFMTTDGGNHWHKQPGGAEALETLDNNVIRVRSDTSGCPPGCSYAVQTASIGGSTWSTVSLPGGNPTGDEVELSRGGSYAYLLVTRDPAGGADNETSTLYRSSDDGERWTDGGEPCPQSGQGPVHEVDSVAVAAGNGAAVTVLCSPRGGVKAASFVTVSANGGMTFHARRFPLDNLVSAQDGWTVLAGDPGTVLAVITPAMSLSYSGGRGWTQPSDLVGTFGFVGFESDKVGRAVTADGSEIWTTRNAGRTWTRSTPDLRAWGCAFAQSVTPGVDTLALGALEC